MNRRAHCSVLLVAVLVAPAFCRIIPIDAAGTGEYPTIQAAVDAAAAGDEVVLAPGTYTGQGNRDIDYAGKGITVRSTNPADPAVAAATVIDCQAGEQDMHRGFDFHTGEAAAAVLDGVTVTGGYLQVYNAYTHYGAAIRCDNSSPTIRRCVLRNNQAREGAGLDCYMSSAQVTACLIEGNAGGYAYAGKGVALRSSQVLLDRCTIRGNTGGGLLIDGGTPVVRDCRISGNSDGISSSVWLLAPAGPTFLNCVIDGNENRGVGCSGPATLRNCLMVANMGPGLNTGGDRIVVTGCVIAGNHQPPPFVDESMGINCSGGTLQVRNSIIWDNGLPGISTWGDGRVDAAFSVVQGGYAGQGNLAIDPRLRADYHLQAGSPCRNAGDPLYAPAGEEKDMDGEPRVAAARVDIGADEFHDADGDGLPDWWEVQYFGSPTAADPAGDPDHDTLPNLVEYQAARNPLRAPRVLCVNPIAGDNAWDGLTPAWNGVHGPKKDIQTAIDAAEMYESDQVVLAPGTYKGAGNRDLDTRGKRITVRSDSPHDPTCVAATVLDAEHAPRAFYIHSGENVECVIDGLTIVGTRDPTQNLNPSAAIYCQLSSPTISRCVFRDCDGSRGDAIACMGGTVIVRDCEFSDIYGPVVYATRGVLAVWGCAFRQVNDAISCDRAYLNLRRSLVAGSWPGGPLLWGVGVFLTDSSAAIAGCTIVGKEKGIHTFANDPVSVVIDNCIVYGCRRAAIEGTPTGVSHSVIQGGFPGPGNLDVNPGLRSDGHLRTDSPCRDAGDPAYLPQPGETDLDGEPPVAPPRVDIGADELHDGDADGLPDWWETRYFHSLSAHSAGDDPDGDGAVNLVEYNRATNPLYAPPARYVDVLFGDDARDGLSPAPGDVHGPKRTIQAAIDAADAPEGAHVVLAVGTYNGPGNWDIDYRGKMITVRSANPHNPAVVAATLIDCQDPTGPGHRAFWFHQQETPDSILEGVTIIGGRVATDVYPLAMPVYGGGILCDSSSPTICSCVIRGNRADLGGGIGCAGGSPVVTHCVIAGNEAYAGGAGLASGNTIPVAMTGSTPPSPVIENCLVIGNRCDPFPEVRPGTILWGVSEGGGILIGAGSGPVMIRNCTIADNRARFLSGGLLAAGNRPVILRSCILWGNQSDQQANLAAAYPESLIDAAFCCVGGGWAGPGNIAVDPLLTADYHLGPLSPCINAGDPAYVPAPGETDMDGQPRVLDGRVDIGADEFTRPGDVDGNGAVDMVDLLHLVDAFGTFTGDVKYSPACDFNHDGAVDVVDLLDLVYNYGK
jgi:hypothetical protein